jgi:hypothetical protein
MFGEPAAVSQEWGSFNANQDFGFLIGDWVGWRVLVWRFAYGRMKISH